MVDATFRNRWLPLGVTAFLTGVCVFLLPYAVAPHPSYSQSYVVGFNNRIAITSVLLISLAVLAASFLAGLKLPQDDDSVQPALRWPFLFGAASAVFVWLGTLSLICLRESARVAEERYFLTQFEKVAFMHRTLYTQVEFAYGPLLFYPTLWVTHLFHGALALDRGYYLTLVVHQVVGLGMLWFTLNRLPLTRTTRLATFAALAIYAANPRMGLNYTLVRFLAAPFCLVVLASLRRALPLLLAAFSAPLLAFFISPESGIAVTVGAVVFGAWTAYLRGERHLLTSAAAVAGFATAIATAPAGFFSGLLHFSRGFHQTILLPSPAVLLALAAAVWFAPISVARAFNSRSEALPLLAALYTASLSSLPVTFATTDSLHLLSNSMGLLLLGAVFVSGHAGLERVWSFALPAVFLLFFVQCLVSVRYGFTSYIGCLDPVHRLPAFAARINPRLGRIALHGEDRGCPAPIAPEALPAPTAQEGFTILSGGDSHLLQKLVRLPQYHPVYFENQVNVWNADAQQNLIQEIRQFPWVIAPAPAVTHPVMPDLDNPLDLNLHLPARHPIAADDLITAEVKSSWQPVLELAPSLWLYRRVH